MHQRHDLRRLSEEARSGHLAAVPLSPSDLVTLGPSSPPGSPVRVAGRISGFDAKRFVLSDAFNNVALVCTAVSHTGAFSSTGPMPTPGDFVELEIESAVDTTDGTGAEHAWHVRRVLQHIPEPEPRGDGETFHLARGRAHLLVARSRALAVIREYFAEYRFLEVATPTFAVCPGLDPHVHSLAPVAWDDETYHLITSPEFHMKRLLVGGLPRIFQIARCFRAEEWGTHHEPEFSLLEWYRAFSGWETMLEDTENLVRRVFRAIGRDREIALLGNNAFLRLTVRDAFARFAEVADAVRLASDDPDAYFTALVDRVEPALAQLGVPVFLTHFPSSQAALAQICQDDPSVAERFELYIGGLELCNGFGELTDAVEQRRRFELEQGRRRAAGEPVYPLDERFLAALTEGMPPAAGNALGLDRLVALATGTSDIASTLSFSHRER